MTNFTPTREQIEAAARAANVEIEFAFVNGCDTAYKITHGRQGGIYKTEWTPWLPGTDCMELMAALKYLRVLMGPGGIVVDYNHGGLIELISHTNTPESKAAALAQAVFLCAAKVGGWRE